ncbi:DUF58 domain-containing protein [Salinicoccus sp. HZC-1]|uniref:DUF58 domain-containing protein n=1 Tax=Salinicoccus sp. HZC-1 TaxID=3385497 RepID=UPI00398B7D90
MGFKTDFKDSKAMTFFIGAAAILFIINIFYSINLNRMIAVSLGLFISFALLNYLYEKNISKRLSIEVLNKEIRMYKNQIDVIRIKITQDGILPILDGQISLSAGDDIRFDHDISTGIRQHTITAIKFTVMPKSSIILEVPFRADSRGVSKIFKSEIRIPQIFGFDSIDLKQKGKIDHEIIIYPDRYAVHNEEMKNQMAQGTFMQKNALFSDPLMTTGTRGYLPRDNMRDIHWKASARTGELQTRIYEKTTKISWMILINLRSENSYAPPKNIEEIFEKLAFITARATQADIPYRIITNMVTFENHSFFRLDEGAGKLHYKRTLESLARLNTVTYTLDFERLLRHVQLHEETPTHIIFTGIADDAIKKELSAFNKKGASIFQLNDFGIVPFRIESDREAYT